MIHWSPEVSGWLILAAIGVALTILSHAEISSNQRARKAGPLPPDLRNAALEILATDRIDEIGRSVALSAASVAGVIALFLPPATIEEVPEHRAITLILLLMMASLDLSAGIAYWRNHRRARRLIRAAEAQLSAGQVAEGGGGGGSAS